MFGNVHYLDSLILRSDHTNLQEGDSSGKGPIKHKAGMLVSGSPWAKLIVQKKYSLFFSYYHMGSLASYRTQLKTRYLTKCDFDLI